MYNLEKVQEEILKEMMKEPLVNNDKALEVYMIFKKCVYTSNVEYFHKAIKQKIWMNEKDNVYEYVYYIFNVILNKYKIKEDAHGIKWN